MRAVEKGTSVEADIPVSLTQIIDTRPELAALRKNAIICKLSIVAQIHHATRITMDYIPYAQPHTPTGEPHD